LDFCTVTFFYKSLNIGRSIFFYGNWIREKENGIMKKLSLVSAFAVALMLVTLLVPTFSPSAMAQQPPVDTTTMYVGTIGWGPRRADPVRAYDTGSGELIFNVYDTLIFFKGEAYWDFEPCLATNVPSKDEGTIVDVTKTVTSTDVNLENPTDSTWNDGSTCIGWVDNVVDGKLGAGDVMYMIEPDGSYRTWQVQSFSAGPPVTVTLIRQQWIFHIRKRMLKATQYTSLMRAAA